MNVRRGLRLCTQVCTSGKQMYKHKLVIKGIFQLNESLSFWGCVRKSWGFQRKRSWVILSQVPQPTLWSFMSCCTLDPPRWQWSSEEPGRTKQLLSHTWWSYRKKSKINVKSWPLDVYQSSCSLHFLSKAATWEESLKEILHQDFTFQHSLLLVPSSGQEFLLETRVMWDP